MGTKPAVWYWPVQSHTDLVFRPEVFRALCEEFDVQVNETGRQLTAEEISAHLADFDAVITGWGTPPFSAEALEKARRLRLIAHSAGSVKHLFPEDTVQRLLIPRGVVVFSANEAIALNVAESAVGLLIMASRRWPDFIFAIRHSGAWRPSGVPMNGQYLRGATIGIVGASAVGREVIRLLAPWDVKIIVYDPYLPKDAAERLGVECVGFNELFERADHVSIHAPATPETQHMVGADQLRRLRDGAVIVNTARGSIIDHDALYAEARTGRIFAALDVTDPEPLPPDSPLRRLDNVYITPHISGAGHYGYFKIGEMTLQALRDFFAGRPVKGAVDLSRLSHLA
ncbi:MAG: hydroxyacid dehydrogenase [Armatimonadetes bacterium]|nr:hydroxyacid dehydrogenase [Armatimonadota bacterium]